MTPASEQGSLLQTLQWLRSRMLQLLFSNRIDAYHQSNHANVAHDIGEQLSGHIDKIAQSKGISPSELNCEIPSRRPRTATSSTDKKAKKGKLTRSFVELSSYFRTRRNGGTVNPHVADSLRDSTWEHIHTALRLAREGNICAAKLHADIANNALKEAAHHMSEEDYGAFKEKVDAQLGNLNHS